MNVLRDWKWWCKTSLRVANSLVSEWKWKKRQRERVTVTNQHRPKKQEPRKNEAQERKICVVDESKKFCLIYRNKNIVTACEDQSMTSLEWDLLTRAKERWKLLWERSTAYSSPESSEIGLACKNFFLLWNKRAAHSFSPILQNLFLFKMDTSACAFPTLFRGCKRNAYWYRCIVLLVADFTNLWRTARLFSTTSHFQIHILMQRI